VIARHVVFEPDPPNTARLVVMAAELRLPSAPVPGNAYRD